ncbi:MAG TPA: type II toxin-antitoxin system RatA family toxin [Steroidobacteraceae bacterium]|nr:type II toxin-antitoxin system RatA family toxin [Steroidobacteraceae bacterium]
MREVRRSALLPYAPPFVYGLVADVERYPEFLPWCTEARILSGDGREVTVTLGLVSGIARARFTTRNRLEPHSSVTMSLVDGPFDVLEGRWDFTPIADAGTRADLHVRFSTHGLLGAIALGPAFEAICNHLVDAFARRARQVTSGR